MKLQDVLNATKQALFEVSQENSLLEAIILIKYITNFSKEEIIFGDKIEISNEDFLKIANLVQRRKNREPISHLIQKREFFGVDFIVNKNVLDPRPDSEILVEEAILLIKEHFAENQKIEMLEIGVGSGCLTISILKNTQNIMAFGVDLSDNALEICSQNIKKHNLQEKFIVEKSDLFAKINKKFDVIISNPPYIKTAEIENLQDEVRVFEPKMALDGGFDGLDFYRKIAAKAKNFLKEKSFIILEIGFDQKNQVIDIFEENNFSLFLQKKDFAQNDRVLIFANHKIEVL